MENVVKDKQIKRCLRCGRVLKDVKSRELGYGKICYSKIKKPRSSPLI